MVAIVGASGVGKSTLLHLLGALDRCDSGTIRVSASELTSMSDAAVVEFRNRHVGFVFQFHHLLPEFDAAENVEMPMRVARIPRQESRRRATELLQRVGLGERLVQGIDDPRIVEHVFGVVRQIAGFGRARVAHRLHQPQLAKPHRLDRSRGRSHVSGVFRADQHNPNRVREWHPGSPLHWELLDVTGPSVAITLAAEQTLTSQAALLVDI